MAQTWLNITTLFLIFIAEEIEYFTSSNWYTPVLLFEKSVVQPSPNKTVRSQSAALVWINTLSKSLCSSATITLQELSASCSTLSGLANSAASRTNIGGTKF